MFPEARTLSSHRPTGLGGSSRRGAQGVAAPADGLNASALADIDALIDAAAQSVGSAPRTLHPAPPRARPVNGSSRHGGAVMSDEIARAAMAAVEAALAGTDIADEAPSGAGGATPAHDYDVERLLAGDGEFARAVAQQKAGTGPTDMADGTLGRMEATLLFVEGHPEHVYERVATTQMLREAAATIRLLREKRDQSWLQMERWFSQWRAAEAQTLDLQSQLKRLNGLHEHVTGMLGMARSFSVNDRIFVEWRGDNAWVVRYDSFLLNRRGRWEPDHADEAADPDYHGRTRYPLADAMSRARAVRLEGRA